MCHPACGNKSGRGRRPRRPALQTVYDFFTRILIRYHRVREAKRLPYTKLLWRSIPPCVILSEKTSRFESLSDKKGSL